MTKKAANDNLDSQIVRAVLDAECDIREGRTYELDAAFREIGERLLATTNPLTNLD